MEKKLKKNYIVPRKMNWSNIRLKGLLERQEFTPGQIAENM